MIQNLKAIAVRRFEDGETSPVARKTQDKKRLAVEKKSLKRGSLSVQNRDVKEVTLFSRKLDSGNNFSS